MIVKEEASKEVGGSDSNMSSRTGLAADGGFYRSLGLTRRKTLTTVIAGCEEEKKKVQWLEQKKGFELQRDQIKDHIERHRIVPGSLVCNILSSRIGIVGAFEGFQIIINDKQYDPCALFVVRIGDTVESKTTGSQVIKAIRQGRILIGGKYYNPKDFSAVASRWPRKE